METDFPTAIKFTRSAQAYLQSRAHHREPMRPDRAFIPPERLARSGREPIGARDEFDGMGNKSRQFGFAAELLDPLRDMEAGERTF